MNNTKDESSLAVTWQFLDAKIGEQTCMGYCLFKYPMSSGNRFSFVEGFHCVNMRAENFKEAAKRFLPDNKVHCITARNYAFVIDYRIPKDWLCEWSETDKISKVHLGLVEKLINAYKACEELAMIDQELEEIDEKLGR